MPDVLVVIISVAERSNFSLESDVIFEVSEDLPHQRCHFAANENLSGLISEVLCCFLLFQMDLVELEMVQKMATETIRANVTTVM